MQAYAMTEASHQMTSNPLPKNGPHKPGTVGLPQGTVKVAVLDKSNRRVAQGTIGEVCLQGPNVTKGYLNNPKANEEGFAGTIQTHPFQSSFPPPALFLLELTEVTASHGYLIPARRSHRAFH
jgi:acyl-CoA synthetase (AMP-forming)/AMP-acid ligase II